MLRTRSLPQNSFSKRNYQFLRKNLIIGSNFLIKNRTVLFEPRGAWQILAESGFCRGNAFVSALRADPISASKCNFDFWRCVLNKVRLHFELNPDDQWCAPRPLPAVAGAKTKNFPYLSSFPRRRVWGEPTKNGKEIFGFASPLSFEKLHNFCYACFVSKESNGSYFYTIKSSILWQLSHRTLSEYEQNKDWHRTTWRKKPI